MTITTIEPLRAAAGSCGLVAGDPAQIAEISPTRLDGYTLAVIRAGQKIYVLRITPQAGPCVACLGGFLLSQEAPGYVGPATVAADEAAAAIEAAEGRGDADVLDPRWALPVAPELVETLRSYDAVVTVEDGLVDGGVGSEIALALSEAGYGGRLRHLGIGRRFLAHASRASVRRSEGLTPEAIGSAVDSVRQGIRP